MLDKDLKNGVANLGALNRSVGNPDVIRILEAVLTSARLGHIHAVSLVTVDPTGAQVNIQSMGEQSGAMVAGLDFLRMKIVDAMFGGGRASGNLLVPGAARMR